MQASPNPDADIVSLTGPSFRLYTTEQGLAANAVQAIAFDSKGQLWLGAQGGASVYDGHAFHTVVFPGAKPSLIVNALLGAADGSMWFGTLDAGLFRLLDGKWEHYDSHSGLPSDEVRALLETTEPNGKRVLWAGTTQGLVRWIDGQWQAVGDHTQTINVLQAGSDGVIWIGTLSGLVRWQDGKQTLFDRKDGLPDKEIRCLLQDDKGLWVGTEHGLATFTQGRFARVSEVPEITVSSLTGNGGEIWIGTYGAGLFHLRDGDWEHFDKNGRLQDDNVRVVATGVGPGKKNLWLGLDIGLAHFVEGGWRSFGAQSLLRAKPTSLLEVPRAEKASAYWFAFENALVRYEDGRWIEYQRPKGSTPDTVYSLITAEENGRTVLLAGTLNGELLRFADNQWTRQDLPSPTAQNSIWALLDVPATHTLWAARRNGLYKRQDGVWSALGIKEGLPSAWIWSLATTRDGTLWAGTYEGLARLRDGKVTINDTHSGLPQNAVGALHAIDRGDGTSAMWVGTGGGGAVRIFLGDKERWSTFSETSQPTAGQWLHQSHRRRQKRPRLLLLHQQRRRSAHFFVRTTVTKSMSTPPRMGCSTTNAKLTPHWSIHAAEFGAAPPPAFLFLRRPMPPSMAAPNRCSYKRPQ